tara:strand:- start:495 stop:806 length:312 start_codon:yes stop_codon:yes gene_type:complete
MTKQDQEGVELGKRVAKGAAWLDQVKPNWRNELNWSFLKIEDRTLCILGQLFTDPSREHLTNGYDYLFCTQPNDWIIDHGFAANNYVVLQELWNEHWPLGEDT